MFNDTIRLASVIATLWQSREPIWCVPAPSARPQTKFEDYHADIVANSHKKSNTSQIRCASQNQCDTNAQLFPMSEITEMPITALAPGDPHHVSIKFVRLQSLLDEAVPPHG